jgi:hypothetical protein
MTKRLLSLTAAGAAVLTLAACGDPGGGTAGKASPRDRAQEGALKFAKCMRENGIDMPDPQVGDNGLVRIGPGPGEGGQGPQDPSSPEHRKALDECGKHLQEGGGEAPDQADLAEHRDAFLAYARCMRTEGIDMPDPSADSGGMVFDSRDPNAPDPTSPAFKAADEVCHEHLAAVDADLKEEGGE